MNLNKMELNLKKEYKGDNYNLKIFPTNYQQNNQNYCW